MRRDGEGGARMDRVCGCGATAGVLVRRLLSSLVGESADWQGAGDGLRDLRLLRR